MIVKKIAVKVKECEMSIQMPEFYQLPFELPGMEDETMPLQSLRTMVGVSIEKGDECLIATGEHGDFAKSWSTAYQCLVPKDQSVAGRLISGASTGDLEMLLSKGSMLSNEPYITWVDTESDLTVVAVLVSSIVTDCGFANTWAAVWM